MFRWALAVIKEVEGLGVCVDGGTFVIGDTRYFTTDEVIARAQRVFGGVKRAI